MSYNEKIEPKNNLYHNKRGLAFSVYDEFDNLIDSQYSCGFLNEGLTELLASKILKRKPSAYEFNCLIVDLLIMNNHNELIEAYFSEDYEKIVNYKNLFEQQADCNFELIFNNQKYGTGISKERTEAMILACIIYQVNSVQSYEELDKIQIDINKILSKYQIFGFEYDIETIIGQTIELINEKKHNFNNKHK